MQAAEESWNEKLYAEERQQKAEEAYKGEAKQKARAIIAEAFSIVQSEFAAGGELQSISHLTGINGFGCAADVSA